MTSPPKKTVSLSSIQLRELPFHQLMSLDASQLSDEELQVLTRKVQVETKNPGSRRAAKSKEEKVLTGKTQVINSDFL